MVYLTSQLKSDVAQCVGAKFLCAQHELQLQHDVGSVGDFIKHHTDWRHSKFLPEALSGMEKPGKVEPATNAT